MFLLYNRIHILLPSSSLPRNLCYTACSAQAKHSNSQIAFLSIFHISPSMSILCQKILAEKLLQSSFCDQTLYITNVRRVISRVTKVDLSSTISELRVKSILPAHGSIYYTMTSCIRNPYHSAFVLF